MTAVEFLVKELKELGALNIDGLHWSDQDDVKKSIEQAQKMEKEQIINAYKYGNQSDVYFKPEQYYNETFKQQEQ